MSQTATRKPGGAPTRRVTISDVSDALGLTKSTVSRALNGYPDISEHTRLRVTRMAEKMRYRPLSHAQAIRTGRTKSIGFIIETSEHDAHRPFLAEFLAGISTAASVEGWTLTVAAAASRSETLSAIEKLCDERKADGFIVPRTFVEDERVDALRRLGIPFVMFGRTGDMTDCAWYDIAGEDAMREAVAKLSALGHERIGFINGGTRYNYSQLRLGGFLDGMVRAGLTPAPHLIREDCLTQEDGCRAARQMLLSGTPPTGFVFALDRAALGLYAAAAELGLTVGRDLSVISYDGIPEGANAQPPLSTFSVDIRRAGAQLGRLLIRRVRGDRAEDLRALEHASFLDRGSAAVPAHTPDQLAEILRPHAAKAKTTNGRKPI